MLALPVEYEAQKSFRYSLSTRRRSAPVVSFYSALDKMLIDKKLSCALG